MLQRLGLEYLYSAAPLRAIEVVQGQPGFLGGIWWGPNDHQREFMFASIWADADAVKARFGEEWRVSHLPPGYSERSKTVPLTTTT